MPTINFNIHDQYVKMQQFLIIVTWLNEFSCSWFDYFFRFNLQKAFKRLVISWSIKQFGTNCRFLQMGRIVAFSKWDELTLGTNCRFLEFGTNCRLGRIVAQPNV